MYTFQRNPGTHDEWDILDQDEPWAPIVFATVYNKENAIYLKRLLNEEEERERYGARNDPAHERVPATTCPPIPGILESDAPK